MNEKSWRLRRLCALAMLVALAYVSIFLRFSFVPGFAHLQYDPKDVLLTIGGFLFGPISGLLTAIIVAVLESIGGLSSTGELFGLLMNIVSSCTFVCVASIIYQYRRKLPGAIIGLICSVLVTTGVMLLWNYLIMPLYMPMATREYVASILLPIITPFNLLKHGINAGLTMVLYKPITSALRSARLLPKKNTEVKKARIPAWLIGALVIVPLALVVLAWNGII